MTSSILIKHVNIIPMPGPRVLRGYDVLIEGARVTKIFPSRDQKNEKFAGRVINGTGKFLIPGLFDMHAHLESKDFLSLFLQCGVTAIREMGNSKKEIFLWRNQINAGKILGPRVFIAGPILEGDPPLWKGFRVVKNKKEGVSAVKELKRQGADFIKVYHTLKPEVHAAILREAHAQGLKVTGHIPESVGIKKAVEMGQDGFEHMSDVSAHIMGRLIAVDARLKNYPEYRRFIDVKIDRAKVKELGLSLKKRRVFLCPTLVVDKKLSQLADYSKLRHSKEAALLPDHYRNVEWSPNHSQSLAYIKGLPPLYFKNSGVVSERVRRILPFLWKHSIILAGSDTPNPFVIPGVSLFEELELLVDSGLQPHQALEAATYNAALFLDALSDLGTIQEGKIANLALLGKNPLKNISHIRSIEGVILNGAYLASRKGK
ncbi:MAG: amidohydrolase family protein [Candidatus Wildermuthbacteria bacterium]|nr:amidohydrolase family protein [Candidatus Wildermuthbacteria bacterium]